jgi:hypothetical protein
MSHPQAFRYLAAVLFSLALSATAFAEEGKKLSVESLIGDYDGTLEIHRERLVEFSYQAQIVPVENDANSVSLIAHCDKCDTKNWKRNKCQINETGETVKFTCKAKNADEVYVFNGDRLKMSGFGAKYPYSIIAKKISK